MPWSSRWRMVSPARGSAMRQLQLQLSSGWGGRRRGAGRKPSGERRMVPHRSRPEHCARHPVHVTLRSAFRPLRSAFVFPTVQGVVARASRRNAEQFRVVHFSVQQDHIHLLVEAADKAALSRGLRSLSITLARRVNALVGRKGRVLADRWHGHALTTPRAVRHALVYVLANFRKHERGATALVDMYSSAPYFDGFLELAGELPVLHRRAGRLRGLAPPRASPVAPARTWLMQAGWRRHGLVRLSEGPATAHHA